MKPANRKHPSVFYGWWIVGASVFISMYTGGAARLSFTALFDPIVTEFGWSYTQISFAASIMGLETGLLAPLVGFLTDRWGPRRLMLIGTTISGFGFLLLSRVTSLGMFYLAFILIATGLSTCVGATLLVSVVNWFRRKVAIAAGIVASGFALGGLLIPVVSLLIDILGWRTAMASLGLGMWFFALPLSLVIRHKPEQYGYLPDGEKGDASLAGQHLAAAQDTSDSIGARQAIRSRVFWHLSTALMLHLFAINAVITHVMPYLSSIGIARATASLVAGAVPVVSILGRINSGWIGDKFNKKWVTAIGFALTGSGLLLLGYVAAWRTWLLIPFLVFFSTGWGSSITMRVALLREYFGRNSFGTIQGFTMAVTMLGSFAGPVVAGWVFDKEGSYQNIWFELAGLIVVSLIVILTMPATASRSEQPFEAHG